jgi:hypothetical protein
MAASEAVHLASEDASAIGSLLLRERSAEGAPLGQVPRCGVQGCLCQAGAGRGDGDAPLAERRECDAIALALPAEAVLHGNLGTFEDQLGRGA